MFPGCVDSVFVAWIDCRDIVLVKVYLASYEKINNFFFLELFKKFTRRFITATKQMEF